MATATTVSSKPKAPRTIVSTKVTANGELKSIISASALKQLETATELCRLIGRVKDFEELANKAAAALADLRETSEK